MNNWIQSLSNLHINTYFTKENITFLLAVIGSLGTIYSMIAQHKNISLSIVSYSYKNKTLLMYVAFTNCSRLPISILNVSIVLDKICYPCVYIPTTVVEHTRHSGKELLSYREELSIQFPVSLSSLAGTSGYLYFDKLPDNYPNAPTTLTLEVSTNRGQAMKMKLSVPLK